MRLLLAGIKYTVVSAPALCASRGKNLLFHYYYWGFLASSTCHFVLHPQSPAGLVLSPPRAIILGHLVNLQVTAAGSTTGSLPMDLKFSTNRGHAVFPFVFYCTRFEPAPGSEAELKRLHAATVPQMPAETPRCIYFCHQRCSAPTRWSISIDFHGHGILNGLFV